MHWIPTLVVVALAAGCGNAGDMERVRQERDAYKGKVADLQKIDEFSVRQFARFLKRMQETPEGEGSLLDQSMIVLGSGLGDGNRHRHEDLPIILAGKGGGTIRTGRHLQLTDKTPLNNLFLSMLHRVGSDTAEFGDSTGGLKQIDV